MKAIPSISGEGWITEPGPMLDRLLSYYILTDTGQSYQFKEGLRSISLVYYKFINDPERFAREVKTDLEDILSRYFAKAEVETRTKFKEGTSEHYILLSAVVTTESGTRHELARITDLGNSKSKRIINTNNFGTGEAYLERL